MSKAWQLPDGYQGTYRLEFADPSFAGLIVKCKRHTFGSVSVTAKLLEMDLEALKAGKLTSSDLSIVDAALREFADVIVSWNLRVPTKDGTDYYTPKISYKSLSKLDLVFVMQLFMVWLKIMVRIEFQDMNPADIPMETVNAQ